MAVGAGINAMQMDATDWSKRSVMPNGRLRSNESFCRLVAPLVGIGQIAARKVAAQSQVARLGRMRVEACFDIARALAKGDLCERHAQELIQAAEGAHIEVASILGDQTTKGVPRRKLHQPGKYQLPRVRHGLPGKSRQTAILGCP